MSLLWVAFVEKFVIVTNTENDPIFVNEVIKAFYQNRTLFT